MADGIKISVNVGNVVERIEKRRRALKEQAREFLRQLAEMGIDDATVRFERAQYDGTNDVAVSPAPIWEGDNKLIIKATGRTVLFIEFGTGVTYAAQSHPMANEFGFTRGGYGYGLGKLDSWRYKGDPGTNGEVIQEGEHEGEVETHGNPANRCMYQTAADMRRAIEEIAREVFR